MVGSMRKRVQKNILGGDYVWEFLPDSDEYKNEAFSAGPILGLKEHQRPVEPHGR